MTNQPQTQAHSRRDLFLAAALQGILTSGYASAAEHVFNDQLTLEDIAEDFAVAATAIADAMIKENPE